ncbi:MAG TPA: polysaccharide deacetylase family protein, partial [Caldilineaceae bacterium]|nr:polysaccharide deacetylase family protein [Caldilineaceae bacterium]
MGETLFVFTNDDAGMQEPALFGQLLDFLKAQEAPATFFVVPNGRGQPLDEKPEWLALLHRALDEGHDLQHH